MLQRPLDTGDQGTVKITEHKDRAEDPALKGIDSFPFEVHLPELCGYPACLRVPSRLREGLSRPVCQNNRKAFRRKEYAVVSVAAGKIKDRIIFQIVRKDVRILDKELIRTGLCPEVTHENPCLRDKP